MVKPRATREKEDTMPIDNIKIGDIEVSRYATKAELEQARLNLAELEISAIDPVAKYNSLKNDLTADRDLVEAYRQLNENISAPIRTLATSSPRRTKAPCFPPSSTR